MAKKRLNTDDTLLNIIGKNNTDDTEQNEVKKINSEAVVNKEKLVKIGVYITEKQRKAIRMKIALGNKPEDKDISSISRAAFDAYLVDILKDL